MKYYELAKSHRLKLRTSLRQFCTELGLDPSNWSKVERGVNPPPRDPATLERVANYLQLIGDERQEFFDAASVARAELPHDLASSDQLVAKLPAFFRAMRGGEPNKEDLLRIVSEIQDLNRQDID